MDGEDRNKTTTNLVIDRIENSELPADEVQDSNQSELFESKLRSILFPEPIFSQYIGELAGKPSKPVRFPSVEAVRGGRKGQQQADSKLPTGPQYTRYLRTWKKSISPNDRLTAYLSNLRELHLAKLIAFIEQMHKNALYTDLDLYVDNLCFPVHKLVLACYAPFIFQKLERSRARPIERLKLVNIDAPSFAILIGYMYTGMAQPTEANFLPVLNAAVHLFMFDFANAWVELYEHRFTSRTAQLLFRSTIARQYGWTDYTQMLNVALALDFEHLLISDQFEALEFEQLRDILRLDNVGVASEIVLYLAVLKWLNFDFEQRKQHALELMRLVRFGNMNENELFACYNPPILPELIELPAIKALMADAFNLRMKHKPAADQTDTAVRGPRNYRLAGAYKPLELWCSLASAKASAQASAPASAKESTKPAGRESFKNSPKDDRLSTVFLRKDGAPESIDATSAASPAVSPTVSTPASSSLADQPTTSFGGSFESSPMPSLLGQGRPKTEIRADTEKLIADGQQRDKEPTKLAMLWPVECRCKPVKHASGERCRQERAAQIIQRTYRRFHRRKHSAERPASDDAEKVPENLTKRLAEKPAERLTGKPAEKPSRQPKIRAKLFGKSTLDKRPDDRRNAKSDGSSIDEQLVDRLALKQKTKKEKLKWKQKLKQDKILMSTSMSEDKSKDWSGEESSQESGKAPPKRSSKGAGRESGKAARKESRKESRKVADEEQAAGGSDARPKPDEQTKPNKSTSTDLLHLTEPFSPHGEPNEQRKVDQRPDAKPGQSAILPVAPVDRPREENETGHLASVGKEPRAQRSEQLILYSDSINQEFCGFFICNFNAAATSPPDGQSTGWLRHFQFNQRNAKRISAPYDTVVVSHGQSVYLVGGMQMKAKSFCVSEQVLRYQLNGRHVEALLSLRTPRVQHSAVVAGDRLYVICGCKAPNQPLNTVECVHLMLASDARSELIKLPTFGRFGQSAVYFRSRLWIIGGIAKIDNNFHLLSEIWVLDVQNANRWIKSKFPVPIAFAGVCSVNEEFIYVVGGRCVGLTGKLQPSEKVWCYSAATRRWQQIASLNQARCNCCCVAVGERIYAFGGSLENEAEYLRGQTGEFYELRNANQGWRMLNKSLPASIAGQSVTKISFF